MNNDPVNYGWFQFDEIKIAHWIIVGRRANSIHFDMHNFTYIYRYLYPYDIYAEMIYPSPNFNGASIEVLKWSNFISHFTGDVIVYLWWWKLIYID